MKCEKLRQQKTQAMGDAPFFEHTQAQMAVFGLLACFWAAALPSASLLPPGGVCRCAGAGLADALHLGTWAPLGCFILN